MQMSIDAALITKKSASLDYNTDSVNAAGKIWPREIVHSENGIKAAGKSQGKPYYVLASADAKGTAESAADLFKNCVASFSDDGLHFSDSIADFFRAFAQVLDKSGYDSSACDLAVFAGHDDQVYLAKSGRAKLYRFADGDFSEAKPLLFPHDDGAASYGVSAYSDVKPDDIFVLLSGKVAAAVSDSLVKAILRNADGDIKKIVALIASNAVKNGCTDAISVIVLKVDQENEAEAEDASIVPPVAAAPLTEDISEELPDAEQAEEETGGLFSTENTERYYAPSDDDIDEEAEVTQKINRYKSRNKFSRVAIIDVCIVLAVIAVLVAILAVKGVFGGKKSQNSTKDGVNMSDILGESETTTKKREDISIEDLTDDEVTTEEPNGEVSTNDNNAVTQRPSGGGQPVTTTRQSYTPVPSTNPLPTSSTTQPEPSTEQPPTEPSTAQPPTEPPTEPPPSVTDPPTSDPNILPDD